MLSLDIYRYKIFVFRIEKVESLARDKIGFFFSQRIFKYSNNIFLAQNFQISTRSSCLHLALVPFEREREREMRDDHKSQLVISELTMSWRSCATYFRTMRARVCVIRNCGIASLRLLSRLFLLIEQYFILYEILQIINLLSYILIIKLQLHKNSFIPLKYPPIFLNSRQNWSVNRFHENRPTAFLHNNRISISSSVSLFPFISSFSTSLSKDCDSKIEKRKKGKETIDSIALKTN